MKNRRLENLDLFRGEIFITPAKRVIKISPAPKQVLFIYRATCAFLSKLKNLPD